MLKVQRILLPLYDYCLGITTFAYVLRPQFFYIMSCVKTLEVFKWTYWTPSKAVLDEDPNIALFGKYHTEVCMNMRFLYTAPRDLLGIFRIIYIYIYIYIYIVPVCDDSRMLLAYVICIHLNFQNPYCWACYSTPNFARSSPSHS